MKAITKEFKNWFVNRYGRTPASIPGSDNFTRVTSTAFEAGRRVGRKEKRKPR